MSRPSTTVNLYPPSSSHTFFSGTNQTSKTLTLWIHDPDASSSLSKHDAVLNYELFPPGIAKPGDVAEVTLVPPPSSASAGGNIPIDGVLGSDSGMTGERMERRGSYAPSVTDAGDDGSSAKRAPPEEQTDGKFLFVIRELEESQRRIGVQISLANDVAALFRFPSRATVKVTIVDKSLHEASHVEISFRDQYINRADMWRMTSALLANSCPYQSQKLVFINSIRANVGNVYVRGEKVQSAYFSSRTVPIFRSESARYAIFIQMSREMWHFDTDDGGDGDGGVYGDPLAGGTGGVGGEIMFNKLINGFLPELFKRWRRREAHHLVSIILFTRVVYDHGERVGVTGNGKECDEFLGTPGGIELGEGRRYRDFFRVVVSNMGSMDWTLILSKLKKEFAIFLRDVLVRPLPDDETATGERLAEPTPPESSAASILSRPNTPAILPIDKLRLAKLPKAKRERKTIIAGRPSAAIHGNVLEAINLATIQFSRGYIDRDLVRTGISILLVTPGTGHFEVDYEMLKATTEGLIANGMGVDLVCLSKLPLHAVPLFRYRNPTVASGPKESDGQIRGLPGLSPPKNPPPAHPLEPGEWVYAVPHWLDISFWSAASEKKIRRNERVGKKKDMKLVKKKSQGFRARCKMYELQMMGIMENEVACISVPYLHENPFWRPLPEEAESRASGAEAERKKWKDSFSWMDDYDEVAFRPLPDLKEALKLAESKKTGREDDEKKIQKKLDEEDPLVLGTSFREAQRGPSVRSGEYFHRKMKERRPELDSPIELRSTDESETPPAPPTTGSTNFLGRPAVRLARQLSSGFGLRPWAAKAPPPPKAAATAEVTGIGTVASGVMVTRGFDTGESPKSPLSFRSSMREPRRIDDSPSPEKGRTGSNPISISGRGSNEVATKERRRTLAGSPLDGRERGIRDLEILKAASSLSRPAARTDLVANAEKTATIPLTVSPTSALAPWIQVTNPSNFQGDASLAEKFRRWHHVFPKPVRSGAVKWKSLCTPAALPLTTEHFPTAEQLATEYQESPYVIALNEEFDINETNGNREELVRAMIALRLTQGFQIVVGPKVAEASQGRGGHAGIFDRHYMVRAGSFCYMSRGSQIHQLICDEEYNVEVKRYIRKPMTAISAPAHTDEYISYVKTVFKDNYVPVRASFAQPVSEYNWNYADQYIGGYEEAMRDQLRYWRARFVLIPCDPPDNVRRSGGLDDEEIRIEGIRRLTMTFQRHRYIPPEERQYDAYASRRPKERNPLQIIYKTVDSSVAVAQELESLTEVDGTVRRSQLLNPTELFDSKNLDLKAIASELQGPRGVRFENRRWHVRFHSNCFIGEDMVTWILDNFGDVNTRAEAERVGSELFKAGLFQHVNFKHPFRDGNFFYRIAESYALPALPRPSSRGGWFGPFKQLPDPTPKTPSIYEHPPVTRSRSSTLTPSIHTSTYTRAEIHLSKCMKFDVDPLRRSYRPEIISLHYDRLHNPDNCYHIRIDWMSTTAKLIEDALTSWARTVDRYGLRLVEAPIDEISKTAERYIFRAPVVMTLCVPPPESMDQLYHKALLRKFNFVLDTEAAGNFPADVKVRYSWGEPNYRYSQWIHRSGVMFAQVDGEGKFLAMANRAYTLRVKSLGVQYVEEDAETIKEQMERFFRDEAGLREFYRQVGREAGEVMEGEEEDLKDGEIGGSFRLPQ